MKEKVLMQFLAMRADKDKNENFNLNDSELLDLNTYFKIRLIKEIIGESDLPWRRHKYNLLKNFIDKSKTGFWVKINKNWIILRDRSKWILSRSRVTKSKKNIDRIGVHHYEDTIISFKKTDKQKLDKSLEKTSKSFLEKLKTVVLGKSTVDAAVLDDLEEILITSDVGVETTLKIIDAIEERVKNEKYTNAQELDLILKEEIQNIIYDEKDSSIFELKDKPHVIMVVGVNGVGKTTSIGKLAKFFSSQGLSVLIGAADTFRAAAIEQLEMWAERADVEIVKQNMGSDPASVAYDTLNSALNKNYDVVIIDTAGRLHNKINLMTELSKIGRVMNKLVHNAPHEIILVLDGSTGQNAFEQAKQFSEATKVTSLMVTKLDGTAKGGVVIGISDQLSVPVKYIGTGEKIDDIELFDKKDFVESFFNKN